MCKCRKTLTGKLVEKCDEDIDRKEMFPNVNLIDYGRVCKSGKIHIALKVLLIITFIIIMDVSGICFYFIGIQ